MEASAAQPQEPQVAERPPLWSFEFHVSYSSGKSETLRYAPTCPPTAAVWAEIDAKGKDQGEAAVVKRILVAGEVYKEIAFTRDFPRLCTTQEAVEYLKENWKKQK